MHKRRVQNQMKSGENKNGANSLKLIPVKTVLKGIALVLEAIQ